MGANQTRHAINRLNKEIMALEKKSVDLGKKEASARGNAARILKGIPKNASIATIRSKQSRIDRYNSIAIKAALDKAENDKKIVGKKDKHAVAMVKLQKEETAEKEKDNKLQSTIQKQYERQVDAIKAQISKNVLGYPNYSSGQQHLYSEQSNENYDVFISYASEDKESIAEPLYKELKTKGVKVWYDAINIRWGDSLRSKIDNGLKRSRYGVVILSNDYINKGWTQYELEGLFQIEMTKGKTILPIWHRILKDEVQAFSPTLAGRKALTTALFSVGEIADELLKLLFPQE